MNKESFAQERLASLAQTLGLTKEATLLVLLKVDAIWDFFQWVDADDFIQRECALLLGREKG